MNRTDDEAATLLAPLRDLEPDPTVGVSIRLAMRAGRRHGRRRTLIGVAAVALVPALLLALLPALLKSLSHNTPAGPGAAFSLAVRAITVGTAGGYTPATYRTGRQVQLVELTRTDIGSGSGSGRVTAYAPGHPFTVNTDVAAPDVNGHRAYWQPDPSDPTLAIMGPAGIRVIVSISGPDIDLVERAHRVAQSIQFAPGTVVTVPFTTPTDIGVPGTQIHPVGVRVDLVRPIAELLLATNDHTYPPMLSITVDAITPEIRSPNDQIAGRDAITEPNSVTVLDVNGARVTASVPIGDLAQIGGVSALKHLVTQVQVVPTPGVRDGWLHAGWW